MQAISTSLVLVLILTSSLAMNTMPTTLTTASPDSPITTTTDQDMVMMSDESSGSGSGPKSAQLTVPGLGSFDFSAFRLPVFSVPSLPNLTIPALPSLPKLFPAMPCISKTGLKPGACLKKEECIAAQGLPDGTCGLTFGVCCAKPFTCGEMVFGNDTLITSPGFPEPSTKSDICSITVVRQIDVVQIRLDLLVFDIAGADSAGACSEDVMTITGANSDAVIPQICGMNHDQHLYIPVDKTVPLAQVMIKFLLSKSSTAHRIFKIRVTQLKQDHPDLAPVGCVQYYNGKEGVIRSFNYEHVKDVGIRSIKGLKYGVCFKKTIADKCKVKLNPTYTRVTRSVGHQVAPVAAAPVRYGYFPAQHPITSYQQRSYNSHNNGPAYRRPVYLNRPILRYYKPQAVVHPVYQHQQQPHVRPVVYYPMPPVKSYYYYPTEKKVELVDKKKEELDGLLAKKKLLIEELSSLLKVPELAKLPSLPTIAPLPTLPSISLPTLPSLPAFSLPSLPSLPALPAIPKLPSLEDLLAKKIEKVDELKKEIKKEDPYKQTHGHGIPAHLYKQPVDLKESLIEKKVDLVNSLLPGHKSLAPVVHYDAYGKPIDLKETLLEKKVDLFNGLVDQKKELLQQKVNVINGLIDAHKSGVKPVAVHYDAYGKPIDLKETLLEKKVDLFNGLVAGHKSAAPHPTYDSYGKKTEVKDIVKEVIDIKKDAVNGVIDSINNLNKNLLLSPLPTFPSMISKDAYGLIVDNDHAELGRGFSIKYKEECDV